MAGIRRSATMRMEEGDATPVAWSSATDNATKDTTNDDADSEKAELEGHRQSQESTPGRRIRNHMPLTVNRFLNLDAQSFSPQTESSSTRKATVNGDARAEEPAPQRSIFKEAIDDNEANNFESVVDLPPLPKLDFKPLILREWTLICIAVFYLGIIAVLGVLYHSGNSARYFHIHATASRFTIRYLPSLIGTLSQLIFQSVLLNFARLLPYIVMAVPVKPEDKCATARQTLLAPYFPVFGLFGPYHAIQNRHFGLAIMGIVANFVNPFLTPAKSALIHKRVSGQDPHLWTISISDASAKYLLLNYSINFLIVLGLLVYLWDRRTGLKWDPVSLADHSMLLQRSDVLDDFSGLEYWSWKGEKTHRLYGLETERYRLGYWRDQRTNKYWHGIRKWPASTRSSSTQNAIDTRPETRPETRPDNVLRTNQEPLVRSPLVPAATPAVESIQDDISPRVDRADPQYAGARGYRTARKIPDITDSSTVARTWWKDQCNRVLENTDACYSSVYLWISDGPATLVFFVVAGSVAFGIWVIRKGPLETGFYFLGSDYELANFILTFLPVLWFQLMNNYWYLIDIWYRQLQPYMGLRQPSPATENLLLCYPCDLPVQITLRALGARHWRLALTSIMPLIQRVVPILARSLLTVETITAEQIYHISIATAPFKAIFGILCAYLFLIPITWPGLDRRLPITPVRIADSIVMFYESTLVRKDAFLPLRHDEQRWHMKYRLCLEERLYGFGIYPGRNGAQHLGIDDVYDHHQGENKLRIVTPLKPPMRPYRRWLKRVGVWSYDLLHIKRQPTLNEEELEVLQKPKVPLKETVSEQAFPSQDRQAAATVEEHLPVNREGLDVGT